MERFLGFVKQIRRSRRRKGKKYRPEEDYHEGYEDVYYYASEHFRKELMILGVMWPQGNRVSLAQVVEILIDPEDEECRTTAFDLTMIVCC
ncbi:hypothetical protein HGM15179_008118 [Zosterops borbonicus]|uniref:Uncharacterized protein n=1 Tax=Zosterops borbonicus TaxID=364589 RepID=A0A8K1GJG1_9PASS|nr:hypothetical protein HGM15179_008118 [Zosterops borbonicus]